MSKKVIVVGSTGKLGTKLINYCFAKKISISIVTCFSNQKKILKQKDKFKIKNSYILSKQRDKDSFIKKLSQNKYSIIYFLDYSCNSLIYLDIFLKNNSNSIIAIANKEMIIAGGNILFDKIKKTNNHFMPLDSEHFSLKNNIIDVSNIKKIYVTASGGPFFFKKIDNFSNVSLSQVLNHPKWKMGVNNTIDSSNFINKILEIYELSYIYNIPINKINFLVSKDAFVHSIIEYMDGVITFNAFKNDMLLTLIYPLNIIFNAKRRFNSFKKIFSTKSFDLSKSYDKRFKFFKYYHEMRKLNHIGQINLMLLNNHSHSLYLSNKLQYDEIIPYTMKKIRNYSRNKKLNSFLDIINYINNFKY